MSSSEASLIHNLTLANVTVLLLCIIASVTLAVLSRYNRSRTTQFSGPGAGWLLGCSPELAQDFSNPVKLYTGWVKQYGKIFPIPLVLGNKEFVVADVKAAAHVMAKDTVGYQTAELSRTLKTNIFGRGILSMEGEEHRRIKKALSPAFSNTALRGYLDTFNLSFEKLQSHWDSLLEGGEATIEVQEWMNSIILDNLGILGFSHDFGMLDGKRPEIIKVLEAFEDYQGTGFSKTLFLIAPAFPWLMRIPSSRMLLLKRMKYSLQGIAQKILMEATKDTEMSGSGGGRAEDKSMISLLIRAMNQDEGQMFSEEEVLAQMNTLFFAGYDTTSAALSWALIELCRRPDVQDRLRDEVTQVLQGGAPEWEHITEKMPYLDAVTQEIHRIHPPVFELTRVAMKDDVVPFSAPVRTASGDVVSEMFVEKGTGLRIPIGFLNQSHELWGEDAGEFRPERWVEGRVAEHQQVFSFSDGPRICLGKPFAIAEIKSTLAQLVRRYRFEFPDGKDTRIGIHMRLLPRPKVEGEEGTNVPLRVYMVN